ncbi:hypothetical protein SPRG_15043 [Saprolegnia parasitica CBS 223.65]|uniref:Uncharacterized protein n=1 Tax=Saprolegnia parasitica (strain CBS 223.65) TaxID=695850 RepID=A0A067BXI0_SAPPC|nr:hypothetical protein SPRG_15043 [Saprolegnia parasitica CBS 223.65]KDO19262.1 hypothetical protein SPRG_15043 [Saprolegnia parasitica CBS 223.65]|eukprot:XP_012210036.1 hypothetical protein SPRG_15043 [Saprolegnia parasitica CBS 223.65]
MQHEDGSPIEEDTSEENAIDMIDAMRGEGFYGKVQARPTGGNHRPISAPPKRYPSHESAQPPQLVETIRGITLQTLPPRPESAKPARASSRQPVQAHVRFRDPESRDRPVSAPQRTAPVKTSSTTSKTYLRRAADKKKEKERDFAIELFQEKIDQERKVAVKITQANKLMRRQGSKKTYYLAKNRDDFVAVRVIEDNVPERLLSTDAFVREFERMTVLWAAKAKDSAPFDDATPAKTPSTRLHPKKETQSGLRMILKGTIELTAILQEQLFELQSKGWNSNTVKALVAPHHAS